MVWHIWLINPEGDHLEVTGRTNWRQNSHRSSRFAARIRRRRRWSVLNVQIRKLTCWPLKEGTVLIGNIHLNPPLIFRGDSLVFWVSNFCYFFKVHDNHFTNSSTINAQFCQANPCKDPLQIKIGAHPDYHNHLQSPIKKIWAYFFYKSTNPEPFECFGHFWATGFPNKTIFWGWPAGTVAINCLERYPP